MCSNSFLLSGRFFIPVGPEDRANMARTLPPGAVPRRLIERGAILEGIFPLAPDLPGAEVKAFLIALSHLSGTAELAAKLPNSEDKS